jgi:hypothetical protein
MRPLAGACRVADDERTRLAEACWALYGRDAGTVVVDGLLAAGPRSRVWRLVAVDRTGTRPYAVKWFRPRYRSTATAPLARDPVATEYAALANLVEVLPGLAGDRYLLRCPAPVQSWDWGYVMSAVPGRRLDEAVTRREVSPAEYAYLARGLVRAVVAFHAANGGPYGDFHPGNVLLGPDRDLYLLDPAPATGWLACWAGQPAPPHLAVDVAHWTYSTAIRALRGSLRHPGTATACAHLARALAEAAVEVTGDPALAGQIDRCLADYWNRLRQSSIAHRALALAAARLVR